VGVASAKDQSFPRPLSEPERRILTALLEPDFLGAAELRAQVLRTEVTGKCKCGCPTVDLAVPLDVAASPATTSAGLAPVQGTVDTSESDADVQHIILFLRDGRLDRLEIWWIGGGPPSAWPPLDRLEVYESDF
jgi:hypothetical protein